MYILDTVKLGRNYQYYKEIINIITFSEGPINNYYRPTVIGLLFSSSGRRPGMSLCHGEASVVRRPSSVVVHNSQEMLLPQFSTNFEYV